MSRAFKINYVLKSSVVKKIIHCLALYDFLKRVGYILEIDKKKSMPYL